MNSEAKELVANIRKLLLENNEYHYDNKIHKALEGAEEEFYKFLESNELWGGAGSVADQGCINNNESRRLLCESLVKLGNIQEEEGRLNVRTKNWVNAFSQWLEKGII
jgi:hypothetical protein